MPKILQLAYAVFMGFKPIGKNFQIHPCSYTCAEFLTFLPYSFPSCHLEELGENGTQDGNTEFGEREEGAVWKRGTTDLYVAGRGVVQLSPGLLSQETTGRAEIGDDGL